jgi:hypothetical protein
LQAAGGRGCAPGLQGAARKRGRGAGIQA